MDWLNWVAFCCSSRLLYLTFLRSEIAWRDAKYAQIYEYLREEYEVTQRFGNLDFKLKFVEVFLPLLVMNITLHSARVFRLVLLRLWRVNFFWVMVKRLGRKFYTLISEDK